MAALYPLGSPEKMAAVTDRVIRTPHRAASSSPALTPRIAFERYAAARISHETEHRGDMDMDFKLMATQLVDQHYASGPDELKQVIAEALAEVAGRTQSTNDPRAQLRREVEDLEKTSERGSE
jgi:hypothetical protein